MVFDFVDNVGQVNMPYSLYRLFQLKDYRPSAPVLSTKQQIVAEKEFYAKGEHPEALIDWSANALDYDFNWQQKPLEWFPSWNLSTEWMSKVKPLSVMSEKKC